MLDGEGLSPRPLRPRPAPGAGGRRGDDASARGRELHARRRGSRTAREHRGEASGGLHGRHERCPTCGWCCRRRARGRGRGARSCGSSTPTRTGWTSTRCAVTIDGADVTPLFAPRGRERGGGAGGVRATARTRWWRRSRTSRGTRARGRATSRSTRRRPRPRSSFRRRRRTAPALRATYSDATSGVVPASVTAWLDGQKVAGLLAGENEATAVLPTDPPLADGEHEIRLELAGPGGELPDGDEAVPARHAGAHGGGRSRPCPTASRTTGRRSCA